MIKSLTNLRECKRLDLDKIDSLVQRANKINEYINRKDILYEGEVRAPFGTYRTTDEIQSRIEIEEQNHVSDLYIKTIKQFNTIKDDALKQKMLNFLEIIKSGTIPFKENNYMKNDIDRLAENIMAIEKTANLDVLQSYVKTNDAMVTDYNNKIKLINDEISYLITQIKQTSFVPIENNVEYTAKLNEIYNDGLTIVEFLKKINTTI